MTITELLEHEAGFIERLADITDPGMTDDVRALFTEVRRVHPIEDAASQLIQACQEQAFIGEMQGNLERALETNCRRPDRETDDA